MNNQGFDEPNNQPPPTIVPEQQFAQPQGFAPNQGYQDPQNFQNAGQTNFYQPGQPQFYAPATQQDPPKEEPKVSRHFHIFRLLLERIKKFSCESLSMINTFYSLVGIGEIPSSINSTGGYIDRCNGTILSWHFLASPATCEYRNNRRNYAHVD